MTLTAIHFTHHAVQRFVKRHVPHLTHRAALSLLVERGAQAVHLRERSLLGQEQYRITDPDAVLVVKRDHGVRGVTCVTVLPAEEVYVDDQLDEAEPVREIAQVIDRVIALADTLPVPATPAEELEAREARALNRRAKQCLRGVLKSLVRRAVHGDETAVDVLEDVRARAPEFLEDWFLGEQRRQS